MYVDSLCLQFVQVRNITSKEKMAKWKKKWRPRTPITSKVKKVKIKFYSYVLIPWLDIIEVKSLLCVSLNKYVLLNLYLRSFKDRFKPLNDGTIRRWKEGKRHNAHLKVTPPLILSSIIWISDFISSFGHCLWKNSMIIARNLTDQKLPSADYFWW